MAKFMLDDADEFVESMNIKLLSVEFEIMALQEITAAGRLESIIEPRFMLEGSIEKFI